MHKGKTMYNKEAGYTYKNSLEWLNSYNIHSGLAEMCRYAIEMSVTYMFMQCSGGLGGPTFSTFFLEKGKEIYL